MPDTADKKKASGLENSGSFGGRVIWITGLSGAGKTTLAGELRRRLPGSVLLDGDEMREALGASSTGFDRGSRLALALTYARFARLLAAQGFTVLVATISLFREVHQWNRENLPGYVEVFLDVPEDVRRTRDPKGLYRRCQEKAGEMAGSDVAVDFPEYPDIRLDHAVPLEDAVWAVLTRLAAAD